MLNGRKKKVRRDIVLCNARVKQIMNHSNRIAG